MASPLGSFTENLQSASAQPNHARATAYEALIVDLLQAPRSKLSRADLLEAASAYLRHAVFSEQNATGGGLVVGRQALTALEHHAGRIAVEHDARKRDENRMQDVEDENMPAICDSDTRREVLENALEQLQPRVLSFEEQASSLRMQLASLLEADEDWNEAARVLLAIPLDSGHRNVSDHFKLSIYVRIARLLLEGDDPVAADMYLKRASMIIHNVPGALPSHFQQQQHQEEEASAGATSAADAASEVGGNAQPGSMDGSGNETISGGAGAKHKLEDAKVLGLQYRLSQARVYDSQRRFAEAAVRYHELSYVGEIDEDDRAMMLSAAVTASILSPAGPQRARMLATLMRDERTPSLPQYTILSKVFLDRLIRADEIADFEKLLSPHQIAKLAPSSAPVAVGESTGESVRHAPSTVLDRAMIEHNVLSASRLYDNITLAGLGALVNLSAEGAEEIARKMIMQGRLKGWIDQVGSSTDEGSARGRGVLFFMDQERRGEGETTAGGLSATKDAGTSAGDGGSGGGGAGVDEGAGGGGGTSDLDTKWTRRWDQQIASVTGALEEVCQRINQISASTAASVAG